MIERAIGESVPARRIDTQCDELRLNVLIHDPMIVLLRAFSTEPLGLL
jgi:hypothetical protein